MATQVLLSDIPRTKAVKAIMSIRHEWETEARGDSLLFMEASVGFLLYDVAEALGLTTEEMKLALGGLASDLEL